MAFNAPKQNPLTSSQSELVSKISSMKNLLSIPSIKQINIPKNQQVSMFDYLNKVMESMGIQPDVLFLVFIDKVFGEASDFLEETVLDGLAETLAKKGISLPNINQSGTIDRETAASFKTQNIAYFTSIIPTNFLGTFKQKMAKDLALMIFGGKDSPSGEYLNPNATERARLINSAVCAAENFDLSNRAIIKNQDLEYNRIALKRQLEAGQVEFEINCQTIKIKLPEDPSFIFEGGGTQAVGGQAITPAQSMEVMVNYVQSQTQGINNEQNTNKAGKSFFKILIEKLIGYFSTIIYAYIDPVMEATQSTPAGANITKDNLIYDSCSIINDPDNQEKSEFSERILNLLLKALLAIILAEVIKKFKSLVASYFVATFLERQKRKSEKIKAKFGLFGNSAADITEKAAKAKRFYDAASSIASIIPITIA